VETARSLDAASDPIPASGRAESASLRAPAPGLVAALLFGSGLCALIYQTAWQRLFQLIFGASAAASSAVLAVFLGGLGAGALFFGRRLGRAARPLEAYGTLELGIAVAAGLSPLLLDALSWLYLASGGSAALGTAGATALRLLIATLVMGVPAFLMGGTLPAAARAIETERDLARTRVALLYGVNTLGAVLGSLLGTFLLFEMFGTRVALWIAALLNLLVAVTARARGRASPPLAIEVDPAAALASSRPGPGRAATRWRTRVALGTSAISGFGFLLLELIWFRMLAPVLGGSTFTFGLILAVALAGIGVGGYIYSRRPEHETVTLGHLASTTALLGLCVALPFAAGDSLAIYAAFTRDLGSWGFTSLVACWAGIAAAVVFPAAVTAGYQFPLLFALLGRGSERVATDIGQLYALNTVGSIAGALLGGFVLIPGAGAIVSWQLAGSVFALTALAALAAALALEARNIVRSAVTGALAGAALAASAAPGPSAAFRHTPIGAGRVKLHGLSHNELVAWQRWQEDQIIWERDGSETAVAVLRENGLSFTVNGKMDGSVYRDRGTQAMLGLLPALLHPRPRSAFVIGLGTGMTAGWLGRVPGMERVDVAELEPAIAEVAQMAAAMNHDVMQQPNVAVHYGDGREQLLTSDRRYDLIASEPSNPYRAGIASLFTEDFYSVVRSRLEPGGVFTQWTQDYEIDARSVRTIARTLTSVFPAVELWQTEGGDLLFLASESELTHSVATLRDKLALEPFRSAVRRLWLVEDAEGVLSHFVAGPRVVETMAQHLAAPINGDDQNFLEYAFARSVGSSTKPAAPQLFAFTRAVGARRPRLDGAVDFERVDELIPRAWLISGNRAPQTDLPAASRARSDAFAAACVGSYEEVMARWQTQPRSEPSDDLERFALALGHAARGEASPLIDDLHQRGYPAEAELARGYLERRAGERAAAVRAYGRGIDAIRAGEIPLCRVATDLVVALREAALPERQLAREALGVLMRGPLIAGLGEAERRASVERLAFSLMRHPETDPALCVEALGRHLARPLWTRELLEQRLECLRRAGHPLASSAESDLIEFLAADSGELLPEPPPRPRREAPPRASAAEAQAEP
jgi:spermidine synthase